MSTSFKNVTPAGPGGTATLLICLLYTSDAADESVGVTFLKDVDIKFFLLVNHI